MATFVQHYRECSEMFGSNLPRMSRADAPPHQATLSRRMTGH
jgi:hypothetical protein